MTEESLYKCEICGNASTIKSRIEKCEKSHLHALGIVSEKFEESKNLIENVPVEIEVSFGSYSKIYNLEYTEKTKQSKYE